MDIPARWPRRLMTGYTLLGTVPSVSDAKLWEAILAHDVPRVSGLVNDGVSPEITDDAGTTALYAAALSGDAALVGVLVAGGADPNRESKGPSEGLPICAAACHSEIDAVRSLLAGGADPNLAEDDGSGYTPLAWAVQHDDIETVQLLLDAGADKNQHVYGRTPLAMAQDQGKTRIVDLLVKRGAHAEREPPPHG
jgi:ankyrin repeat protein